MSVKGYLIFVPSENVASMEYGGTPTTPGSVTRPDMATVATTPGHVAGPFEVVEVRENPPWADQFDKILAEDAPDIGMPPIGGTMAELYTASVPECPQHGPMKPRTGNVGGYTATTYVCPGFDGEGCDYEAAPLEWKHVGWAEDVEIKFTAPLDSPNARIALGGDA